MNKRDILFENEDGVFSYRTGEILIHNGKVLLQQCNGEKDYAIRGGHVNFGEISKDTVVREFKKQALRLKLKGYYGLERCFFHGIISRVIRYVCTF